MKILLTLFVLFFSSFVNAKEFKFEDLTVDEIESFLNEFFYGDDYLNDEDIKQFKKNNKLKRILSDTQIEGVKENTAILVEYDHYWIDEENKFNTRPFISKISIFDQEGLIQFQERTTGGEDDWDFREYREYKNNNATVTQTAFKNEEKWSIINFNHYDNIVLNQASIGGSALFLYDNQGKLLNITANSYTAKYTRDELFHKVIIQSKMVKYEEEYLYLIKDEENWIVNQKKVSSFLDPSSEDEFTYTIPKNLTYRNLLSYDNELIGNKSHADLSVQDRKKIKNFILKNIKIPGSESLGKYTAIVYYISFDENGDIDKASDLYIPKRNKEIIEKTINQITKLNEVGINKNKLKNKFIVFPFHYNLL